MFIKLERGESIIKYFGRYYISRLTMWYKDIFKLRAIFMKEKSLVIICFESGLKTYSHIESELKI